MTGFGRACVDQPDRKITFELKSLNGKNLDATLRLPQKYRELESELRKLLGEKLHRGKVDLILQVQNTEPETAALIDAGVVRGYMNQLREIINPGDDLALLEIAMKLPDVLQSDTGEINEETRQGVLKAARDAISALDGFRLEEGRELEHDFRLRISTIRDLLKQVQGHESERVPHVRERLRSSLSEIDVTVDENRFEQELIYYLEKYDITEEVVRLGKHLDYFEETLEETEFVVGKKLGFISQEIGREINTIGSKANYAPMQRLVVQMKDELEKIKEQMLNVL